MKHCVPLPIVKMPPMSSPHCAPSNPSMNSSYVRKAGELSDLALTEALPLITAGADEGKILATMQGVIFEGGGDYPANEFIMGSGPDALLCRYKAGRRKLDAQDQITLEWAAAYRHYHVPMMRTVVVGQPTARHEKLFETAREALKAVEESMRARQHIW